MSLIPTAEDLAHTTRGVGVSVILDQLLKPYDGAILGMDSEELMQNGHVYVNGRRVGVKLHQHDGIVTIDDVVEIVCLRSTVRW